MLYRIGHAHYCKTLKLIVWQLALLGSLALSLFLLGFWHVSVSFLLGGLIYVLPNFYFVRKLFRDTRARAVNKILRAFYWGELIKLLLITCLFGAIITWLPVNAFALLLGVIVAALSSFMVPLLLFMAR